MESRKRRPSDQDDNALQPPSQQQRTDTVDDGMTEDERLIFDDQDTPGFDASILSPILSSIGFAAQEDMNRVKFQYNGTDPEFESHLKSPTPLSGREVLMKIARLSRSRLRRLLLPLHSHTREYFINLLVYVRISRKDFQVSTWTHCKWIDTPQLASEIETILVKSLKLVRQVTIDGIVYHLKTAEGVTRLGSLEKIRQRFRRKGESMFGENEVARLSASRISTLKVWAARAPTPFCDPNETKRTNSLPAASLPVGETNSRPAASLPVGGTNSLPKVSLPVGGGAQAGSISSIPAAWNSAQNQHAILLQAMGINNINSNVSRSMNGTLLKDPPVVQQPSAQANQNLYQATNGAASRTGNTPIYTLLTQLRRNHKRPSPSVKRVLESIDELKAKYYKRGILENEVLDIEIAQLDQALEEFTGMATSASIKLSTERPNGIFMTSDQHTPTKDELAALLTNNQQKQEYLDEYKVQFQRALQSALEKADE